MNNDQKRTLLELKTLMTIQIAMEAEKKEDLKKAVGAGALACECETYRIAIGDSDSLKEFDIICFFLMRVIKRYRYTPIADRLPALTAFDESIEVLEENTSTMRPVIPIVKAKLAYYCSKCSEILREEDKEREYVDQAIDVLRQLNALNRFKFRAQWYELQYKKGRILVGEDAVDADAADVAMAYKLCTHAYRGAWRGRFSFSNDNRELCRDVMKKCCELQRILAKKQNESFGEKLWYFREFKHDLFKILRTVVFGVFYIAEEAIDEFSSRFRKQD